MLSAERVKERVKELNNRIEGHKTEDYKTKVTCWGTRNNNAGRSAAVKEVDCQNKFK